MAEETPITPIPSVTPEPPKPAPDTQPAPSGDTGLDPEKQYPWLKDRLDRAKRVEREELLKTLGFEDPDSLKSFVDEGRKLQESQLSEREKLQKAIQERDAKIDKLMKEKDEAIQSRVRDKRDAAIRDAANKIRAEHPEDVLTWILTSGDVADMVDESGSVDDKKVLAQVEACRKERPNWFGGKGPGVPSNRDGTPPDSKAEREKKAFSNPLVRF